MIRTLEFRFETSSMEWRTCSAHGETPAILSIAATALSVLTEAVIVLTNFFRTTRTNSRFPAPSGNPAVASMLATVFCPQGKPSKQLHLSRPTGINESPLEFQPPKAKKAKNSKNIYFSHKNDGFCPAGFAKICGHEATGRGSMGKD
jgi:hypothetical protein